MALIRANHLCFCICVEGENNATVRNINRLIGPILSLLPAAFACTINFSSISITVL